MSQQEPELCKTIVDYVHTSCSAPRSRRGRIQQVLSLGQHLTITGSPVRVLFVFLSSSLSFCFLRAVPLAYGSSQDTSGIGAAAAGLHHSHSNARSKVSVTCTTAHGNVRSLIHRAMPGITPVTSWMLVRFISSEPQQELS